MQGNTGSRIKNLREKRGWTQLDLADRARMNNSVLSRIEAGKRPVESEELKTFAQIFKVSTDYLAGYNNTNEAKEYLDIIDLSEEEAIDKIKKSFKHNGKDITDQQARKIYYFSLGVVDADS